MYEYGYFWYHAIIYLCFSTKYYHNNKNKRVKMDPLTLFALANGAVSAVKAGCKLYKDIKGAAGDIKDVLKDLDSQFSKAHPPEKPPSVEAKRQFIEEKNRVIALNKRANAGEHGDVYHDIGESLGAYFDNYYKCVAIFDEEELRAKTEVYTGDESLGKRALKRVLMRKQLEQMGVELRETMTYQSPSELGAMWTEVNEMMRQMSAEQSVLIKKQLRESKRQEKIRKQKLVQLRQNIVIGLSAISFSIFVGICMAYVVEDRIKKYPELGTDWIPHRETTSTTVKNYTYTGR
jgi:hypothetical protein